MLYWSGGSDWPNSSNKAGVVGRYQQCIMQEVKMSPVFNYRHRCHDCNNLSFTFQVQKTNLSFPVSNGLRCYGYSKDGFGLYDHGNYARTLFRNCQSTCLLSLQKGTRTLKPGLFYCLEYSSVFWMAGRTFEWTWKLDLRISESIDERGQLGAIGYMAWNSPVKITRGVWVQHLLPSLADLYFHRSDSLPYHNCFECHDAQKDS